MKCCTIHGKKIIVEGVGPLFFREGFPISMSVAFCKDRGYEVSILHVADECLKNGWSPKTTYSKLKVDFEDAIEGATVDLELLRKFCDAGYEEQRVMIHEYLFKDATEEEKRNFVISYFKEGGIL